MMLEIPVLRGHKPQHRRFLIGRALSRPYKERGEARVNISFAAFRTRHMFLNRRFHSCREGGADRQCNRGPGGWFELSKNPKFPSTGRIELNERLRTHGFQPSSVGQGRFYLRIVYIEKARGEGFVLLHYPPVEAENIDCAVHDAPPSEK